MIVFRLTKGKYKNKISGKGAELNGGRWNNKGTSIIYTGENRALCTTEIAVHVPLGIVPKNYFLQTIKIPSTKISKIEISKLHKNWNQNPPIPDTRNIGDIFVKENKNLVIKVPSAVVQDEYNYLINPDHKDFNKIQLLKVEVFKFDKRLFKR